MKIQGIVKNGVVVLLGGAVLPEGTLVTVTYQPDEAGISFAENRKRVEFPLVKSDKPGSVMLTNQQIWEIFDEEEIEALKRTQREKESDETSAS